MEKRNLPEGWEWKKLGELIELKYGAGLKAERRNTFGDVPVYGSNGIVGYHNISIADKPSIIVGRKGSVGAIHLSMAPCWPIDTTYYIESPKKLEIEYLYYLMKSLQLNLLDKSTSIPGLNRNDVYAKSIPLPPLPVQRRIVEILEQADALRRLRTQADAETQKLLQSVFYEMFGDPVRNEKGWEIHKFGEITVNLDEKRIPIKKLERKITNRLYPYYGASGIIDYVDDFIFDGSFLLIGEDGANLLARTTPIAFRAQGKIWVNNHAHVIQVGNEICEIFLEFYINSIELKKWITGTAQPKLTQKALNDIPVLLPPLFFQKQFANIIEQIEYTQKIQNNSKHQIDRLFDSLMIKAFYGELN